MDWRREVSDMTISSDRFVDDGAPVEPVVIPVAAPAREGTALRLPTAECWRLLEHASLARLAVTDARGAPDVFPVNFVAFEGSLYVRTARGTKLDRVTAHPAVALEIDGEDAHSRWSVVVHGTAQQVRDDAEFHSSGAASLVPAEPGHKPFAIRITPHNVTGRRFPKPEPKRSAPVKTAASIPVVSTESGPVRAVRPEPIPHRPPITKGS
jgi:hypothetical protein